MADNILENEFMWQEQQKKKKLYKNWKLYAIALGIIVIGAGTGLGIYYGINTNHSEVTKIDLSNLNTDSITGIENMSEQDAFNAFVSNSKITLEKENVEISNFIQPTYTTEGSVTIKAKENSKKYTGSITLTINAIKQIALSTLNLNFPTIQGIENMKAESAFGIFTYYNPTIAQYVEVGTFIAPTYTTEGSLIINAIKDSKYTGSVTVKINAIGQTKLESLNLNTNLTGTEKIQNDETGQEAFNAFLEANSGITDLKDNVEVGTFIAPTYTTEGSLIINAIKDGKYTGSIKITYSVLQVSEDQIINEINQGNYQVQTTINSLVSSINEKITKDFIQKQLTGEIAKAFDGNKFTFNKITYNGNDLEDADLLKSQTINAKINYNYGSITNKETNLIINVDQYQLQDVLKDFQFKDNYNVENFLNSNDQATIESQISDFLNISSLSAAGLILENQTSNSVILKATEDSQNYQGEITLSWNLKLFEIWGITTDLGITDPNNSQAELKGYFYLDNNNSIKYFDVYGYKKPGESNNVSVYDWLHNFTFQNETGTSKTFEFSNTQQTNEIEEQFGSFDLTNKTTVTITSRVYPNARIFDNETSQWIGLNGETTLEINNSGQIIISN